LPITGYSSIDDHLFGAGAPYFLLTKILVVDDHRGVRTMFRSLLEKHSFEVCGEAPNGKEAVENARKLSPDIVLLDICMPVMNGIEAAHEIRRVVPAAKIVFLTTAVSARWAEASH